MRRGFLRDLLLLLLALSLAYMAVLLLLYTYGKTSPVFSQNILVRTMVEKHRSVVRWFQD